MEAAHIVPASVSVCQRALVTMQDGHLASSTNPLMPVSYTKD